ncbi:MAG: hypothetical protein HFJ54_09170 [Clostridia bacterium]|nr:hypothetical protein [Clostridia bacterium]
MVEAGGNQGGQGQSLVTVKVEPKNRSRKIRFRLVYRKCTSNNNMYSK